MFVRGIAVTEHKLVANRFDSFRYRIDLPRRSCFSERVAVRKKSRRAELWSGRKIIAEKTSCRVRRTGHPRRIQGNKNHCLHSRSGKAIVRRSRTRRTCRNVRKLRFRRSSTHGACLGSRPCSKFRALQLSRKRRDDFPAEDFSSGSLACIAASPL